MFISGAILAIESLLITNFFIDYWIIINNDCVLLALAILTDLAMFITIIFNLIYLYDHILILSVSLAISLAVFLFITKLIIDLLNKSNVSMNCFKMPNGWLDFFKGYKFRKMQQSAETNSFIANSTDIKLNIHPVPEYSDPEDQEEEEEQ